VKKQQESKEMHSWRASVAKDRGPAGIHLIAELLNWDPDTVNPASFNERDNRRAAIERIQGEVKREKLYRNQRKSSGWRDRFRKIQAELKSDVLSIVEPTPLSEEELSKKYYGILPGIDRASSALDNRLLLLWHKLRAFKWPMVGILVDGSGAVSIGLEGETNMPPLLFETGGQKISKYERSTIYQRGIKETLYFVLLCALRNRTISNLRICKYQPCRKFFVPKRSSEHCSEICRTRDSNESRKKTGVFRDYYYKRKEQRFKKAKRLLDLEKTVQDVLEQVPGLTQKALERNPEITKILAKRERRV
jgi:hypothetical protein